MKKSILLAVFCCLLCTLLLPNVWGQTITTVAGTGAFTYIGVDTPATAANIARPVSVLSDKKGNVYVANSLRIFKIDTAGYITLVAGNGVVTGYYGGEGGQATAARLIDTYGLKMNKKGELYFITELNRICKIDTNGIISTIAGNHNSGYAGDGGPAISAALHEPHGLEFDTNGNLYIADYGNHVIRKIDTFGVIRKVAGIYSPGYNGDNISALSAALYYPTAVAVNNAGEMFIAEEFNSRIRKVDASGIIHTICGNGTQYYSGDGVSAISASVNGPYDIALDAMGNVFFADLGSNAIRKIGTDGIITTFAGHPPGGGFGGDSGIARSAYLNMPYAISFDENENLYIADNQNNRIRKVKRCTPVVAPVIGAEQLCIGSDFVFTDTTIGGTWASSNAAILSVSNGLAHASSLGSVTLSYSKTNACGSISSYKTVDVVAPAHIDSVNGPSAICAGSSAQLLGYAVGTYTTLWFSSADSIATVTPLPTANTGLLSGITPGNATVHFVISNACGADTAHHAITVNTAPDAGIITGATSLCAGDSTYLHSTIPGGVWHSYSAHIILDTVAGKVKGISAGTAIITYSVSNSICTSMVIDTITIIALPLLTSSLTPPGICNGQAFSYTPASNVPTATFYWQRSSTAGIGNAPASGVGNPLEILENMTALPATATYKFTISGNGCNNTQNVVATIFPIPSLTSDTTATACSNTPFTISLSSATPGTSYLWSRPYVAGITPNTASGFANISETLANNSTTPATILYNVTLSANGCSNNAHVHLLLYPLNLSDRKITTHSPSYLCANNQYQNFGTDTLPPSGISYRWTAEGAQIYVVGHASQYCLVNFNDAGFANIYLDTWDSANRCPSRDMFTVYVADNISEAAEVVYQDGNFICLNNIESNYQWGYDNSYTLDSVLLTGETNQSYYNPQPDINNKLYWVITTRNGCTHKNYYRIPTAVSEITVVQPDVAVFPNPTSGKFTLHFNYALTSPANVRVSNLVGNVVMETTVSGDTELTLPAQLPAGIFTLTLYNAGSVSNKKVTLTR